MATFAVLLAAQEIVFRTIFPLPEAIGFNRVRYQLLARQDSRAWPLYRRGLVYERLLFESQLDGFAEVHGLNLYGFRGDDFNIDRAHGRRRILFIGDSATEGEGAPQDATIPAIFAEQLTRDGDTAEVINLGVVAASLRESTPLARDAIALLKPTDVVFILFANDLPAPPYDGSLDAPAPAFSRRQEPFLVPWAIQLLGRVVANEPIYRRWPHPRVPFFLPVPDSTNPWTRSNGPPPGLDPAAYRAMAAGKLNPWLLQQSRTIPRMLAHDFRTQGGLPDRYLKRVAASCEEIQARLLVGYVPFCGVTHSRYARAQVRLGMVAATAEALAVDPVYRRQNEMLAEVCHRLRLPFVDTTEALVRAEAEGDPQYWDFDTHPRPSGYATIARRLYEVWQQASGARRAG